MMAEFDIKGDREVPFDLGDVEVDNDGRYQIGPYTVTPGDDASGLMAYVVRMQAALEEAIQALHKNEVKANQLTSQVSQLTEEKAHAVSKLNVMTRTVQEREQKWRKTQNDLYKFREEQAELEKKGPRKAAADAKRSLAEKKTELRACRQEVSDLKSKVAALEKEQSTAHVKVGVLEEELSVSGRRHQTLEEQRVAAQEQVHALNWKLQAFEGQYASLYQQYAQQISATPPAKDHPEIPRSLPLPTSIDQDDNYGNQQGSSHLQNVTSDYSADCVSSKGRSMLSIPQHHTMGPSGVKRDAVQMRGSQIRRRSNLTSWIPEWFAHRLNLRSTPRMKLFLLCYVFILHVLLAIWIFSPSCYILPPLDGKDLPSLNSDR